MNTQLLNGPENAKITLILAHGAGAGMDTAFMTLFAEGVANHGVRVIRFNFDYMETMRKTGRRRPPDPMPKLLDRFVGVINSVKSEPLFIGGKSMGGRVASMIAAGHGDIHAPIAGCICLGYPFHPPGKPDRLRLDHFSTLKTPVLICQGERDPFGTTGEVADFSLPDAVQVHFLPDGEHSFKPRKASGLTLEDNIASAVAASAAFIEAHQT